MIFGRFSIFKGKFDELFYYCHLIQLFLLNNTGKIFQISQKFFKTKLRTATNHNENNKWRKKNG